MSIASLASILRVRSTGNGQFRPRRSREAEGTPEIIFGGAREFSLGDVPEKSQTFWIRSCEKKRLKTVMTMVNRT
jgi:hypothetical protein